MIPQSAKGRIKSRKTPSFKKIKKSISISRWLLAKIDNYAEKFNLKRSQVIERALQSYFSNVNFNDALIEMEMKKVELAASQANLDNMLHRKKLIKEMEN